VRVIRVRVRVRVILGLLRVLANLGTRKRSAARERPGGATSRRTQPAT
jgi:hypothetical protein